MASTVIALSPRCYREIARPMPAELHAVGAEKGQRTGPRIGCRRLVARSGRGTVECVFGVRIELQFISGATRIEDCSQLFRGLFTDRRVVFAGEDQDGGARTGEALLERFQIGMRSRTIE